MEYLTLTLGFVILLGSAELLVRGSVTIARLFGISPMVIGMTIVAIGTSAPELVVSVEAALSDAAGLAIGNVVGSNIANVLLIIGTTGVIAPIICDPKAFKRDGTVLAASSLVFALLCWQGELGRFSGATLLLLLVAFLYYSYWREKNAEDPEAAELHAQEADEVEGFNNSPWIAVAATLGGLGLLIFGANLLVDSGVSIARALGVSEDVIGLTMIALGTSLPELAASGVAAFRGHTDVALGNVVGSNLFNMLGVMGVVAVVQPITISPQILGFDLWAMLISTVLLLFFLITRHRLSRMESVLLLLGYVAYIGIQAKGVGTILPGLLG